MRTVFKISYYLRSNYKNKEGKCPIMIRISLNGKMATLGSSGLSVNPQEWDKKYSRMKGKSVKVRQFNHKMDSISAELNDIINKLSYENNLSIERIKEIYKGTAKQITSFLPLYSEYNAGVKNMVGTTITKYTYFRYARSEKYLKEFLCSESKQSVKLSEINHFLLDCFANFLKKEKQYSHNSAMKLLQPIKTVMEYAVKKELINHNPIKDYRLSFQKTDRGFLVDSELKRIMQKDFSIARLERVRDIFIFSCFTGLAYVDVANLTTDNLVENNGNYWLMTHRQKTNETSNILLLDIPLKILQKYRDEMKDDKLLPVMSNQKTNAYLKEIADLCGIHKKLTFHLARHTFATTVTLAKGVPIETVSKMLGHTNIRTTQIYARITTEKIQKEMTDLSNKLNDYTMLI